MISIWLRVATALLEIVVGTVAQLIIGAVISSTVLGVNEPWIKFLAGTEEIILTFPAGAELDPEVFKKVEGSNGPGSHGFVAPFSGVAAGESLFQKWLGSVARRVLSYAHCSVIVVRC